MAKVKRSDLAKMTMEQGSQPPVPPSDDMVEPDTWTESDTPDTVAAPVDPRDASIHRLQVGLTIVSLVAVCLVVAVVLLLFRGGTTPIDDPSSPTVPTEPAPSTPELYSFTHYVAVNPNVKPGALVVELHDDYQCPWCERAEQIYGDALAALSQSGDIDLRIHIRTLVGDQIIHNDSSERAGIAALCANKVGHFWDYHTTIFANQPQEGVGYTDDQLRVDFAAQAGISGQDLTSFQTCYDTKATSAELTAMETEGTAAGINGTPSFFVNGQKAGFDLQSNSATVQPWDPANLLSELQRVFG